MGRPNKCRKKVTLKRKNKGNILNLRIGKVSRRTLAEANLAEISGPSTEQNMITTPTDTNVSTPVPVRNCETEDSIQELVETIGEKDTQGGTIAGL